MHKTLTLCLKHAQNIKIMHETCININIMHTKGLKWGYYAWNRLEMRTLCMVCLSLYLCVCVSECVCLCVGAFCNHWYGVLFPGFPPGVAYFSVIWRTYWCGLLRHINVALKMISSSCLVLSQILEVVGHISRYARALYLRHKGNAFWNLCLLGKHTASTIGCHSVAPSTWLGCGLLCLLYRYSTIKDLWLTVPKHTLLWHTLLHVLRQAGKCRTKKSRIKYATPGIS